VNGGDPSLRAIASGLYEIGDPPFTSPFPSAASVYSYLLTVSPAPSPAPATLGATWIGGQYNGWYLFLTEPIADPETFAVSARKKLPQAQVPPPRDWRSLTWLAADDPATLLYILPLQLQGSTTRTLANVTVMFGWGDFGLQMSGSPTISYEAGTGSFFFSGSIPSLFIQFFYGGVVQNGGYLPYNSSSPSMWNLTLPGAGAGTGGFRFNVAIDPGNLTAGLQCGLRFFYPAGDKVANLYYTFSPPVVASTDPTGFIGYLATLHPLLTTDPAWSSFAIDTSTTEYPESGKQQYPYFVTTTGKTIVLAPSATPAPFPAGLAFCAAPSNGSPEKTTLYLAPAGTYEVISVGGATAPSGDVAPLMCGLSGQEALELQPGDLVGLIPGQPAYAGQFSASGPPLQASSPASPSGTSPGESMALSSRYTTSWVRFPLPAPEADPVVRSYFGQPSTSVYYAATGSGYSAPVTSLLADLAQPTTFPLVPYSGIFASQGAPRNVPVFNTGVPAAAFSAFEGSAISSDRHTAATAGTPGPRFLPSGTTNQFRRATLRADSLPGTSLTPQGFVVETDAEGVWQRLLIARDPAPGTPPGYISFEAGQAPSVSRDVANAVLQEQLFLVISDDANMGVFSDTLTLQGFNFTLDVGSGGDVETIVIFKFNTNMSLRDFAQAPDLWASREQFVTNLPLTQQRILDALEVAGVFSPPTALRAGTDSFADFRTLAEDPAWTGILFLNAAIDGNGMPPDLQMLLGGINGQLRAHHLGVAHNRVTTAGRISTLEESSLFGLILYPPPGAAAAPPPPPVPVALDYNVEELHVLFANSAITTFAVEVGLTINRIFGRDTQLGGTVSPPGGTVSPPGGTASPSSPSENVLLMPGQYQTQGSGDAVVGVVLFHVDPTTFLFPALPGATRVLDQLLVSSGSLAPVSRNDTPTGGTHMVARFALAGSLRFSPSPFPNAADLDIYSYDALPYTSLTVTMEFELDKEGALKPGTKVLTFDPTLFKPTSEKAVLRPNSFMYSIPLQISGFLTANESRPLSTSSLSAQIVHTLQLEGHASSSISPVSPVDPLESAQPPTDYPYVTATPAFALQFDMPLGNLGALSDVVSLTARLLLGWGPSTLLPDADAAALFVQLPQLSAGYGSFNLQGILQTTFGDANLLKVELENSNVYAVLFNNIKLSVLGFSFPPGVVIDFLLFAGQPDGQSDASSTNTSNIAWYLSAQKVNG